jgi:SAM-dependent methyltransferase
VSSLGYAGTREESRAIWERNGRRWALVPGRPTRGDVDVYRRLIGERRGSVAIFGVTPELRDLCAELDLEPLLVDDSPAMYEGTTALLERADPSRETWLERDWLMAELPASFDLVLGDQLWWILSVAGQERLRDVVHAALKPGGLFVGRMRFADRALRDVDPVEAAQPLLERGDERALAWFVCDHTADVEHQRVDLAAARRLLEELAAELPEHAGFIRAVGLLSADWTWQTRGELLPLLEERFRLVGEGRAGDYDSRGFPILAFQPR